MPMFLQKSIFKQKNYRKFHPKGLKAYKEETNGIIMEEK